MRYTEDVKWSYHNSEDQYLSASEKAALGYECRMRRHRPRGRNSAATQLITAVIAVSIMVFIIFVVVFNFAGKTEKMADIGDALTFFILYGTACLISFLLLKKKISLSVYDPARNAFSCVYFGLAAIASFPAFLMFGNLSIYFLFAVPGLYFISAFFFRLTERVRMYKKTVEARCTGYSRRITYSRRLGVSCYISPVWDYDVTGERISSVYDRYDNKWNSEVEIDSTKTVYVREKDPESMISPNKGFIPFVLLVFGVLLLGISIYPNI